MKKYSLAVWITGLSGTGKTTLANIIADRLRERGIPLIMLDGDNLTPPKPEIAIEEPIEKNKKKEDD